MNALCRGLGRTVNVALECVKYVQIMRTSERRSAYLEEEAKGEGRAEAKVNFWNEERMCGMHRKDLQKGFAEARKNLRVERRRTTP